MAALKINEPIVKFLFILSSRKFLTQILFFVLPFLFWIYLAKAFVFGAIAVNMDTFTIYGVTKYYFNNLLNGVVPLWDPFVYLGTPFYAIAICNLFNPVTQLVALLKLAGMNYYDAFIVYLCAYYFIGCLGFYFLTKSLWNDRRIAYAGYLLILFSGIGVAIFNQMTILELFVPAVWFFYFGLEFARHFRKSDFLGLIYALMVLGISYLPFYFITLFLMFVFASILFFPQAAWIFLRRFFQFIKGNLLLMMLCALAIGVAVLPLALYKGIDISGEVVSPGRHCANTTITECYNRTLSDKGAMSYEETSRSGGLGERIHLRYLFSHLDKLSYGSDHLFFIPVWGYLLVILTLFVRLNRTLGVLYFLFGFLTLIAMADTSGLHRFLYENFFYFKYFRNLFFFEAYLMPIIILIALGQLKNLLDLKSNSLTQKKILIVTVIVMHAGFAVFLNSLGNIVSSTWITLALSVVLFTLYFLGLLSKKEWIWKAGLFILIVLNPTQVFLKYAEHAKEFFCPLPKNHVQPEFVYSRPSKDEYPPCRIFQFAHYENFWHAMAMIDSQGLIGYPASVTRYVFELSQRTEELAFNDYIRHKLIVYDKMPEEMNMAANAPTFIERETPELRVDHFDVNRVNVTTNFSSPKFLVYNDSFTRHWKAWVNGQPVELHRANFAFKGVWLESGKNLVQFSYEPPLGGGVYIFVTIVFIAFLLFVIKAQWREKITYAE